MAKERYVPEDVFDSLVRKLTFLTSHNISVIVLIMMLMMLDYGVNKGMAGAPGCPGWLYKPHSAMRRFASQSDD